MIRPTQYEATIEDNNGCHISTMTAMIPRGQRCDRCSKEISLHEKSIAWETPDLYLHSHCAEEMALMILRDVAEIRWGEELAEGFWPIVRKWLRDKRTEKPIFENRTRAPYYLFKREK